MGVVIEFSFSRAYFDSFSLQKLLEGMEFAVDWNAGLLENLPGVRDTVEGWEEGISMIMAALMCLPSYDRKSEQDFEDWLSTSPAMENCRKTEGRFLEECCKLGAILTPDTPSSGQAMGALVCFVLRNYGDESMLVDFMRFVEASQGRAVPTFTNDALEVLAELLIFPTDTFSLSHTDMDSTEQELYARRVVYILDLALHGQSVCYR